MASISVRGASKTKGLVRDIKDIANFCLHRLMQDRLANKIAVDFFIMKEIDDEEESEGGGGTIGDCEWMDDAYSPKEFSVRIATHSIKNGRLKKFNRREILEIVCHELVHVKQQAKKEKYFHQRKDLVKFRGKLYDTNKVNYWDFPWEIEAYGRERGLYEMWLESKKSKK